MEEKYFTLALCTDAEGNMFNVVIPEGYGINPDDLVSFDDPDCGTSDLLDVIETEYMSAYSREFRYIENLAPVVPFQSVTAMYTRDYSREAGKDAE